MLFSGGLDSLAGAARQAIKQGRRLLLVNHRGPSKVEPALLALHEGIALHRPRVRPALLRVRADKASAATRDSNQPARSFLYAALGAAVATSVGLNSCSFYENGVTSLNPPPAGQVVGSRASRSTHPAFLRHAGAFLSALLGTMFVLESPFLWLTKTAV